VKLPTFIGVTAHALVWTDARHKSFEVCGAEAPPFSASVGIDKERPGRYWGRLFILGREFRGSILLPELANVEGCRSRQQAFNRLEDAAHAFSREAGRPFRTRRKCARRGRP
jgi:hypothetical protein